MKKWVCIIGTLCESIWHIQAQQVDTTGLAFLRQCITYLASDKLQGRQPQTIGDTLSQAYLIAQCKQLKLLPYYGKKYCQAVTYKKNNSPCYTANIIGKSKSKGKQIFLTAHYDHLGYDFTHSKNYTKDRTQFHAGADDNASGVSLVLLLAQHLQQHPIAGYQFVFCFFGGHEDGLHGSQHFVKNWKKKKRSTCALLINFDMVGRMDKQQASLIVRNYSDSITNSFITHLQTHSNTSGINIFLRSDEGYSDHQSFKNVVPSISLTTGLHDDYHRTSDTADKINYDGILRIKTLLVAALQLPTTGEK